MSPAANAAHAEKQCLTDRAFPVLETCQTPNPFGTGSKTFCVNNFFFSPTKRTLLLEKENSN